MTDRREARIPKRGEERCPELVVIHRDVVEPAGSAVKPDGWNNGGLWGDVPHELTVRTFMASNHDDGLASKAVAMVRVKNPNDNRIHNIAFTHMQADKEFDDKDSQTTRAAQLFRAAAAAEYPHVELAAVIENGLGQANALADETPPGEREKGRRPRPGERGKGWTVKV